MLELQIPPQSKVIQRPLRERFLPTGTIVGAILRDDHVIIPRGHDWLEAGDHAILFTIESKVKSVEALIYQ